MTEISSLSGEGDNLRQEFNDSFFEQLLVKALQDHSRTKKYSHECKSAIINTVGEFMPCFIVLGYDYNGSSIEIVKGQTDQERESLGMRLQKFVPTFLNSQFNIRTDDT
jgi:hypothetical protein